MENEFDLYGDIHNSNKSIKFGGFCAEFEKFCLLLQKIRLTMNVVC